MKQVHIPVGIIPTIVAALTLAACGGGTGTASGGGASSPSAAALIHTASMKVSDKTQTVLKNTKGLTLYYFTPDTATTIACTGGCASNWPPLLSTAGTPTSTPALPGQLTVLNGAEGIGQLFSQVLGMGATAIPMLRGLLDQTNGGGPRAAGETKETAKRSD